MGFGELKDFDGDKDCGLLFRILKQRERWVKNLKDLSLSLLYLKKKTLFGSFSFA